MCVCVCARARCASESECVCLCVGCRSNTSKVSICTFVLVSKSGFEGEGPPLQQQTHVHDARVSIPTHVKPTAIYIANSNTDSQKTSNKETRYQPKCRGSRNLGRSERPTDFPCRILLPDPSGPACERRARAGRRERAGVGEWHHTQKRSDLNANSCTYITTRHKVLIAQRLHKHKKKINLSLCVSI